MPRIHPKQLLRARATDKHLLRLLPVCRDVASASNELRWMHEHAIGFANRFGLPSQIRILDGFVTRRARGEPLQYILGSEFFGSLEIKCRRGVLIPRQETAVSVSHLVQVLGSWGRIDALTTPLRVLDLCTGTGCISLLFHHEAYSLQTERMIDLVGVDISGRALNVARENLVLQIAEQAELYEHGSVRMRSLHRIGFVLADVLAEQQTTTANTPLPLMQALERLEPNSIRPRFDVLIANPPYVSPDHYRTATTRSVRDYEPRVALVPPRNGNESDTAVGDLFYPRLLRAAEQVNAKVLLLEVGDFEQAKRVAALTAAQGIWEAIEIWRDNAEALSSGSEHISCGDYDVQVLGNGHGRSIFAYRRNT